MSSVSGSTPAVPLSQLTGPLGNAPTPQDAGDAAVIIPPAFAGQGRGFSALNFGLQPPANNGTAEASLQEINDALDAVRGDVDDAAAEIEGSRRLAALGLSTEELAAVAEAVAALVDLETTAIPAQAQTLAQADATVRARETDVAAAEVALAEAEAEAALAAADPASPTDALIQTVDTARANLDAARNSLDAAEGARDAAADQLDALEAEADALRTETVPAAREVVSLANLSVPALGNEASETTVALLIDLLGEEAFAQVVQAAIEDTETNIYDVAVVLETLDRIAQDLDEIRVAKVGLAFSAIMVTLQEALNALATSADLAAASPSTLGGGEGRTRLSLGGAV
ncbi:MAG: hypothetical protein AAF318_01330 [Pseudomonadota bacterium]